MTPDEAKRLKAGDTVLVRATITVADPLRGEDVCVAVHRSYGKSEFFVGTGEIHGQETASAQ